MKRVLTNASTQLGIQYSVISLCSWPELSRVPPPMVLDTARVCALLAIRPTGAPLIARLLDLPKERVSQIVELLHFHGHLEDAPAPQCAATQVDEVDSPAIAVETATQKTSSLLGRLWRKLSGTRT